MCSVVVLLRRTSSAIWCVGHIVANEMFGDVFRLEHGSGVFGVLG